MTVTGGVLETFVGLGARGVGDAGWPDGAAEGGVVVARVGVVDAGAGVVATGVDGVVVVVIPAGAVAFVAVVVVAVLGVVVGAVVVLGVVVLGVVVGAVVVLVVVAGELSVAAGEGSVVVGGVADVVVVVSEPVEVVSTELVAVSTSVDTETLDGEAVVTARATPPAETAAATTTPATAATTKRRGGRVIRGPRASAMPVRARQRGAGNAIAIPRSAVSVNSASGYSTTCNGTSNVARQSTGLSLDEWRSSRLGSATVPDQPVY